MKDNTDIALKNSEDFLDFPGQGDRMNEIANIAASSERDSVQSEPNDAHNDGEEVDQHDTVAICDPKMLVERPLAHEVSNPSPRVLGTVSQGAPCLNACYTSSACTA